MRLESQLFTRRDGLVLGDHAGQLVRDGDRWLVATSSWGDFEPGTSTSGTASPPTTCSTGVHVLETEATPLPTEHGSWDPALTRIDGTWQVGFVESPSQEPFDFHPALATSASDALVQGPVPGRGRHRPAPVRGSDHRHGRRDDVPAGQRRGRPALPGLRPDRATDRAARRAVPHEHPAPQPDPGPRGRMAAGDVRRHAVRRQGDGVRRPRRRDRHALDLTLHGGTCPPGAAPWQDVRRRPRLPRRVRPQ